MSELQQAIWRVTECVLLAVFYVFGFCTALVLMVTGTPLADVPRKTGSIVDKVFHLSPEDDAR